MTSIDMNTQMEAMKIWEEPYMAKLRAQKEAAAVDPDAAFYSFCATFKTFTTVRELCAAKADYEKEQKKLQEQTVAVPRVTVVQKEPSIVATSSTMALDDNSSETTSAQDEEKAAPSNAFQVLMQPKQKETKDEVADKDDTEDANESTKKAAPKKKISEVKETPAKRAKKEQKPAETPKTQEIEHTFDGLVRAALVKDNQAALTKDKMSQYMRDPRRASFALASLVAIGVVMGDRKGGRLINRCTKVFLDGNVLDKGGLNVIGVDLTASDGRKAHFVDLGKQEMALLMSNDNPKKYKEHEKKRIVEHEALKAVCDEVLRPVPFNKLASRSFPFSENWQIFVLPYMTADGKKVADMIRVKCFPALADIKLKRTYINCMFGGEVDEHGVSLIDLAMIGNVIKDDCDIDIEEFNKAYNSGSVYEWFQKNFPAACDESKENCLKPEHVELTLIEENIERDSEEPKRRAPPKKAKKEADGEEGEQTKTTTTTTTNGAETKKAKPKKAKKTDDAASANAAGDTKVNGKETIAKFSTVTSVPGKAPLVATATHIFFGSLSSDHEKSPVETQLIAAIQNSDVDAKQDAACPLKSMSAIRSVVAPSSEAKVASNVPKKGKNKKSASQTTASTAADANGVNDDEAANGANVDEEEVHIPESARSQYFAYAAKIPKASRRMLMGTDQTNSANHTVSDSKKPATKVESDVKTKDFYSRVIATARLNNHVIFNPATIAMLLQGADEGKPEWLALLSRSESLLTNSIFKLAHDANTRGDFQVGEENVTSMCQTEKFAVFVANFLTMHSFLTQAKLSIGDENGWKNVMAMIPQVENKLSDVGNGWL